MKAFQNGEFKGKGHWIDQKAEGDYLVDCSIADGPEGSKVHELKRTFLKPDGSTLYQELSTVTFEEAAKNGLKITITTVKGSVHGSGYYFDRQCHYDLDISPDNHLEFTFTVGQGQIAGLASATNKGNFTSWTENLKLI